ncbi:cupin domain-containing protein [Paenibacillus sp. YN15]|uniref:cupin domain-containing protein n=1 Tax=Paenibacillus sp. YN15 TaxID=1742774 RepID=UPI000DCAE707|nr:cupin domain-containing protein [Paenibacillus sp. YN15]RAU92154.1 hypothetical protein DQG13_27950 [Paenibacillus sp. YN15]
MSAKMTGIEISAFEGKGYTRVHGFNGWCVALINYADHLQTAHVSRLERHLLTDEVFLLLSGQASLFVGDELREIPMETGKLYIVKKGAWHTVTLSEDACVAVVENDGTGPENTQYYLDRGEADEDRSG